MADAAADRIRIGKVCDQLRGEFPDISISKLRFLEDQGLVRPHRTPGGYRMYDARDVEKLRHVLRMQRDEFLPLRVIRDELRRRLAHGPSSGGAGTAGGAGTGSRTGVRAEGGGEGTAGSGRRAALVAPEQHVDEAELLAAAGAGSDLLAACRDADLVRGRRRADGSGSIEYSRQEVGIVRVAAQLAALGVEPRHLRQLRTAVANAAALVDQHARPRLHARSREQRQQGAQELEALTGALQELMWLALVHDVRDATRRTLAAAGPVREASDVAPGPLLR